MSLKIDVITSVLKPVAILIALAISRNKITRLLIRHSFSPYSFPSTILAGAASAPLTFIGRAIRW